MSWKNLSIEKRKEIAARIAETRRKNDSYKQSKESYEKMVRTSRERGVYDRPPEYYEKMQESRRNSPLHKTRNNSIKRNLPVDTVKIVKKNVTTEKQTHTPRNTSSELLFESMLIGRGYVEHIHYEKQKRIGRYYADFYLVESHLVVEINGCYWHQCAACGKTYGLKKKGGGILTAAEVHAKDAERRQYIESKGYTVAEFWDHEIIRYKSY